MDAEPLAVTFSAALLDRLTPLPPCKLIVPEAVMRRWLTGVVGGAAAGAEAVLDPQARGVQPRQAGGLYVSHIAEAVLNRAPRGARPPL